MHSLGQHNGNHQMQQYLQLQQNAAMKNSATLGGPNSLISKHQGPMSDLNPMLNKFAGGLGTSNGSNNIHSVNDPYYGSGGAGTNMGHNNVSMPFSGAQQQRYALMEEEAIYSFILELFHPDSREQALAQLAKRRETFEDLAVVLWNSFGVMSILLQEIANVYPLLDAELTNSISNRVCNALALLQCVASHSETRLPFLGSWCRIISKEFV
ncbi:RNA-binding protein, CCR4-NOT complex subunit Rcd1 [Basidiobolus ranarum]|uniref:RNA-binding protein, CCR4-NOT complex subunit Rcd1 n=1 Tax=Basidiobolus ranarum TaxID=34480 RepID=A0ABR2VJX8_9FUNG